MPNFESSANFESREQTIDKLVETFAEEQGMTADQVLSDIATFAPHEGNEDPNFEYLDQVAEMLGISAEEMQEYAIAKAKELLG